MKIEYEKNAKQITKHSADISLGTGFSGFIGHTGAINDKPGTFLKVCGKIISVSDVYGKWNIFNDVHIYNYKDEGLLII